MVRSMIAGVAGLRAHQAKLDVIGNNLANVNTWGYKSYSYNFRDAMYTNSINGTGGDTLAGSTGGRNASQVGYGSTLSSITTEFGTGAPSPSSNPMDCMIDGTGFFLVGSLVNGSFTNIRDSGLYLSRVGIFRVDDNGYLVDDQGSYVYGYAVKDGTGIPEVPATSASYAVTKAPVTIKENQGGATEVTIGGITVTTTEMEFKDRVKDWADKVAKSGTVTTGDNPLAGYVVDLNNYQDPTYDAAGNVTADGTVNLTIRKSVSGPDGNADKVTAAFTDGTTKYIVTTNEGNIREASINAEYETQLSTLRIPSGYNMLSYAINADGTIMGTDDQNRVIPVGQLALVTVENVNGLEKSNGYYYTIGDNAGDVNDQAAGGAAGLIKSGYLEMANVDMANEFSNMITTQRGFQANSKIITVTDEMLQELVNMKR